MKYDVISMHRYRFVIPDENCNANNLYLVIPVLNYHIVLYFVKLVHYIKSEYMKNKLLYINGLDTNLIVDIAINNLK